MLRKLITTILLSSLLLVPTIIIFSSAKPPRIEAHLITSKSDYKKFGYNNVENPYIYQKQVLSDAHLPIAIKISKLQPVAKGFLKHIIAKQIGKFRQIKVEYLILVNQSYTVKIPIYSTRQKTITIHNNQTGENETRIINETYISGYRNETRYRYVWKPINKATLKRLEPDKYYIFDIHGIIKPSTGKFSVDIIPEFNFGGNRIQLKQFAWWNSNWRYRKKMVIANASNNYQMKITVYKNDGYDDPASATIDCEGHCRDDFGDIRFANETAELSYWIEEVNNSNYSIIWVKLPSDIEAQADPSIYMYYGNPSATTTSDGNNTFLLFFDDFEYADSPANHEWSVTESANGVIETTTTHAKTGERSLRIYDADDGGNYVARDVSFGESIIEEYFYDQGDYSSDETHIFGYDQPIRVFIGIHDGHSTTNYVYRIGGTWYTTSIARTVGWHKFKITYDGSQYKCYIDDTEIGSTGTGQSSPTKIVLGSLWSREVSENFHDAVRVRKYVDPEPTWSSFESEEAGSKPQFSSISPENGATGIVPTYNQGVNTSAYISQRDGKKMNITFYWNDSGVWKSYASWTNVGNGTYYAWNANFTALNTTYEWAINATIYGEPQNYTNQTHSFTTLDDILPAWFIANEDSTSITLEWGTSPQADSYYIRYDTVPHSTWTPTTGTLLVNTTSTSYTHTGLTAGTTYYYALFIWNGTYGYSTEYKEDHTNTPYTSPNVVISNPSPSDGQKHVDIANNPPDPGGYVHIAFQLNDTDGGGDMEYWLYIFDWQTNTWINRIHLTNQESQTVTQDETTFNTTGTYYYYRICTLEGGQYNNMTVKFLTDRKPAQPIAINPLNNSIISDELIPLKVSIYHPDYEYGWTGLEFDGANDNVRVPDDPSLNLTSSFTIDFAIWIDTLPNDGQFDTIISKMTNANTGWGVSVYNDGGNAELMICVNGHNQTVGTAQLQPHTWLYLTVVFDNSTHTMYVYQNGTEVYNYTEPNTPSANTADVVIGECSYVGNDKTFDGRMDYIRVYNVALTPEEVRANFYGKNDQCVKRGLISWWKFDENTGTTASDSWGSNDGTLEDGVSWVTGSSTTSSYYTRVYNVTFHEYPSGRLIGYNYSASGFDNGEIVTCNTTYYAPYKGTNYYWYAVAYDDEYNTSSPVFKFTTYYNDTEPNTVYYTLGANLSIKYFDISITEFPANQSTQGLFTAPNGTHYMNLSITINDSVGDLMNYTIRTNASGTWKTLKSETGVTNGTYWVHCYDMNQENTRYWWQINVSDWRDGDKFWGNYTYYFDTSTLPTITIISPDNNSTPSAGYITLEAQVTHPSSLMNITFYEYLPNGVTRVIGTNNSVGDGTYRQQFYCPYKGTKYWWFVTAEELDSHGNQSSGILTFTTDYPDPEPDTVYYAMGSQINVYYMPSISFEYPSNGSTNIPINTHLTVYSYKYSDLVNWTVRFYANDTVDESWHQIGSDQVVSLGQYVNNLTVNDTLSSGTFYHTTANESGLILNYNISSLEYYYSNNYSTDPNMENPSKGRYIIHKDISIPSNFTMIINVSKVAQSIGHYGAGLFFGLSNSEFDNLCLFAISDDTDNAGISSNLGVNAYVNGSYVASTWTELTDTNWHELKIVINNNIAEFYVDDVSKGSISCDGNYLASHIDRFVLMGSTASYISYDIDEWDSANQNMHFKYRRTDVGTYIDFRWDDLSITSVFDIAYYTSGYRQSPEYSLSGRAKSTKITWNSTEPSGTSISVYYNLYNGATWSGWQLATNGGSISGISDGDLIDGYKIKFNISLSTTDTSKTPILHNLTLNIDRYTKLTIPFCDLQYNTTYWWYVTLTNETSVIQSDTYHFTTTLYTDPEPNTIYYTLGANITIAIVANLSHPTPSNDATGIPINTYLSCWINKTGEPMTFDVTFYTNDTVDNSWAEIGTVYDVTPNATVSIPFCDLQYNRTYWWYAKAVNTSTGKQATSSVWSFTTTPYNDTEPSTVYYTLGANQTIIYPPSFSDEYPANNSVDVSINTYLKINMTKQGETVNFTVYFYSNDTVDGSWHLIHSTPISVNSTNHTATVPFCDLQYNTTYWWYAEARNDTLGVVYQSDIYHFTTTPYNDTEPSTVYYTLGGNITVRPYTITVSPANNSQFVPVRRKLVTGEWKYFVRLKVNLVTNGTPVDLKIWVDDPTQAGYQWTMRLSNENAGNGTYMQDEEWFNQTDTTYYWKVTINDDTYIFTFHTEFFFWSYFTYHPADPTQEDTVHFIDQSVNATDIAWYINGERVAYNNYTSGNHEPFNLTYQFMPGVYNVTLWIHNDTCNNIDIWYENITIDWNVTLNTTQGGAGINYIAPPLDTNASHLASLLLRNGEWIHKYNSTTESWESIWMYKNSTIGDNFKINEWDGLAVVVGTDRKVRINISEPTNTTQDKTIDKGYHYIGWSDTDELISVNASQIGLQTGDWIFLYDTKNATWYGYRVNFAGDTFTIKPHCVIVVNVGGQRHIRIPPLGGG